MAAVIVHGGAGTVPDAIVEAYVEGCRLAAEKAYKLLESGNSALDAVEAAVRSLEDNPVYNAGHGSMLNKAGQVQMDAIIIDGSTLNYGAVASVKDISNPVSLARMVMEKTSHVMLVGEGANQFAADMGVPKVDSSTLITPKARKVWEKYSKYDNVVSEVVNQGDKLGHDTVGAVAMDTKGNFASATSTGGIALQMVGRVGDSPLIGAGAACNHFGGVSTTGHGESIAKVMLAQRVLNQLMEGRKDTVTPQNLEEAMKEALKYMLNSIGGRGGVIGICRNGEIAKCHTTSRMAWASVDTKGNRDSGITNSQ